MLMRRQFVLTLILLPITFGIWYSAGALFAAPAVWLCDLFLTNVYPGIVEAGGLQDAEMSVVTQYGETGGQILPAKEAGNQIALQINTLSVSYSIAFYAALLLASNLQDGLYKFCIGLLWLWVIMAFGLASIVGKELLLLVGAAFSSAPGVPPADFLALTYQFNVLLMPTLAPVCVWLWQLRGSPLWEALADDIRRASAKS